MHFKHDILMVNYSTIGSRCELLFLIIVFPHFISLFFLIMYFLKQLHTEGTFRLKDSVHLAIHLFLCMMLTEEK